MIVKIAAMLMSFAGSNVPPDVFILLPANSLNEKRKNYVVNRIPPNWKSLNYHP